MIDDSNKLINESSITYISINQSEIGNSYFEEDSDFAPLRSMLNSILDSFNDIKDLRKNFILNEYEEKTKKIRNNIRLIRKQYFSEKNIKEKNKEVKSGKSGIKTNITQNNPSSNQSNLITNVQSNTGNNTNINQETNNIIKISNNIFSNLNETTFIEENKKDNNIINKPKNINEIYNIILEIVSFLLCYDDIYINYENKSAFFTLKLFLQISTLDFFKNINKQDFLLMIINKICNILCKYNRLQKADESIKKILILDEKEINKLKDVFNYDSKYINTIQKKLRKEINKFENDLPNKIEKINDEKIIDKLMIEEENELKLDFQDDINYKFNKLNQENEILDKIQNNLDETHKMFLKEPIRKELEIFNLLMNKLSKYKTPLIKKKFMEIIVRNKEVFNYINEDILFGKIPKSVIQNYNIYSFNKNLSVFIDKHIITGKMILDLLSIPLHQDFMKIADYLEIYSTEFLNILFESCKINPNPKYTINYYHKILFAFMMNSNLPQKDDYFNRISALITSNINITNFYESLEKIENILLTKEIKDSNIILFDYINNNKNKISFLLEIINEKEKKENKKNKYAIANISSNLELCSILSKKLFENNSLYIILTISIKYWGIKRKLFKYDYIKRKNEFPILDDTTLLYFIYYFLIHKDKIDLLKPKYENEDKKKKKEENTEEKKEGKEEKKEKEKKNEEEKSDKNDKRSPKKDQNKINKKEEIKKDNLSSSLKLLGELFIEFFWFIHELIKLALDEKNKDKIICLSLSSKNYILKDQDYNEKENEIILKLIYSDTLIYQLDKTNANRLKQETTRALYFLLSESNELFAFAEHFPIKVKKMSVKK